MGNQHSNCIPKVPLSVLRAELLQLNQAQCCEMAVLPTHLDVSEEEFENWMVRRCKKFTEAEHNKLFVKIKDFNVHHLSPHLSTPEECAGFLNRIKWQAIRTVRIVTRLISQDRPEKLRCGQAPGSTFKRFGTGYVLNTYPSKDTFPGFVHGISFFIRTAAHVIYDKDEVQQATVEFFVNDDVDRSRVIVAKGISVVGVVVENDFCQFMCNVDNESVGAEVNQRMNELSTRPFDVSSPLSLSYCVAHPHGLSQRVSIGKVIDIIEDKLEERQLGKQILFIQSRCVTDTMIETKKVWFAVCKYGLIDSFLSHVADSHKSTHIDCVLTHLESKALLEKPTDKEDMCLQTHIDSIDDAQRTEVNQTFKSRYGAQILNAGDKDLKQNEIYDEIIDGKLNSVNITGNLIKIYRMILREIMKKMFEMRTGDKRYVDNIKSLSYSTPTCPGSSGALVNIFIKSYQEGARQFFGHHSRAGKGGNMCGSGHSLIHS